MWPFVIAMALVGQSEPCHLMTEWIDWRMPACADGEVLEWREDDEFGDGFSILMEPWCCPVSKADIVFDDMDYDASVGIRLDKDADNDPVWEIKTLDDWICVKRKLVTTTATTR